jgi:hypothetical protein
MLSCSDIFLFCYLPFLPLYASAKLSCFPEVKLGVNIPAHGESHDLLNVDGDKNDYEWYAPSPAYATLSCINGIVVVAHLGYQHLMRYALQLSALHLFCDVHRIHSMHIHGL